MATDNTKLLRVPAGEEGDVIRTDALPDGSKAPASKILLGDNGADDNFVHSGNPMPAQAYVGSTPVSGANRMPSESHLFVNGSAVAAVNRVPVSIDSVDVDITSQLNSFGYLPTAGLSTVFDAKFVDHGNALWFDSSTSGTGTVTFNQSISARELSTGGTGSGAAAISQSKYYAPYQPGKVQRAFLTGVMAAQAANVRQRIGLFDGFDGLFFEDDGTNYKVVVENTVAPSTTEVNQASWNIDVFDGNGPSGVTLDWTSRLIFVIEYAWLGVGYARFGFVIDGRLWYAHEFLFSNDGSTGVYMYRPELPVHYAIENTGVAGSSTTLQQICCSVQAVGGYQERGVSRSVSRGVTSVEVGAAETPIMAVRLNFNFISKILHLLWIQFWTNDSNAFRWRLTLNPTTLDTPAPTWNLAGTEGIFEYAINPTNIAGGETLQEGYWAGGTPRASERVRFDDFIPLMGNIAGTADILVLSGLRTGGQDATTFAAMGFKEIY